MNGTGAYAAVGISSAINAAVVYGIARGLVKVDVKKSQRLALWSFGIQGALGVILVAAGVYRAERMSPQLPPSAGDPGVLPTTVAGAYIFPGGISIPG